MLERVNQGRLDVGCGRGKKEKRPQWQVCSSRL
jgi:hypothetical protein